MSKFKVGDKVRVISLAHKCACELNEIVTIRKVENGYTSPVYWFEEKGRIGLYEFDIELVEPKKTFTIQEVLVEENIGKKFEFNEIIYELDCCLDLVRECNDNIEDDYFLKDILNGTFTLIEEPKPFTEEIDFKEAFKRLCDGEEVKFELPNDRFDILKLDGDKIKYKPMNLGEFLTLNAGLRYLISEACYTKYYKK